MTVAVINESYPIYNLGAAKIANYHRFRGDQVYTGPWTPMDLWMCDKFYFSVIFTWEIERMIRHVNLVRGWGKPVEIGGPAATFIAGHIEKRTRVRVHRGLDSRFEQVPGNYEVTFTSRGCQNGCKFCGVRRVEPQSCEYDDFGLSHIVQDNNIVCTSWGHQVLVVERFKSFPGELDFNSGFDVRFFTEDHWKLYEPLELFASHRGRHLRFAFDSMAVEPDFRRVMEMLRSFGLDRHQVQVYCLIGFPGQTEEECRYRLETVIDYGMNPYPMRFWPLNSLRRKYVAAGWTRDLLQAMCAFYQNPQLWTSGSWKDFWKDYRKRKVQTVDECQQVLSL